MKYLIFLIYYFTIISAMPIGYFLDQELEEYVDSDAGNDQNRTEIEAEASFSKITKLINCV